jgi:malate dehydrogenase (oxaloacetate-decarboxylating)
MARGSQLTLLQRPTQSLIRSQSIYMHKPHLASMSSKHKQQNPHKDHPKYGNLRLGTSGPQDCALVGSALLNTPYFNKGSAFPANERKEFNLTGLIPQHVATLEEQVKRAYQQYSNQTDDLAKNTFMTSMKEQNEVLYYRVSV